MTDCCKNSNSYIFLEERNTWLVAAEADFIKLCRFEPFKSTGRGGQKKNKTSSAVRLVHIPTSISVEASGSRSQHENRSEAIKKMKFRLALLVRSKNSPVPEPLEMSMNNAKYPQWVAFVVDNLFDCGFDIKEAAIQIGFSSSKLAKLLFRDSNLWQDINFRRGQNNLPPLRNPKS